MSSLFQQSTSLSSVAISQHHQRMRLTFHNSYVILEFVTGTVICWTELTCWCLNYSSKAKLLQSWNHRYGNSTAIITIRLTAMEYPNLKWQWIFNFLRRFVLPSITAKTMLGLTIYIWVTRHVSSKINELPTIRVQLRFWRGSCCSSA